MKIEQAVHDVLHGLEQPGLACAAALGKQKVEQYIAWKPKYRLCASYGDQKTYPGAGGGGLLPPLVPVFPSLGKGDDDEGHELESVLAEVRADLSELGHAERVAVEKVDDTNMQEEGHDQCGKAGWPSMSGAAIK